MNVLFIHQAFPGQFKNVARLLAQDPANDVRFISRPNANQIAGVTRETYTPARGVAAPTHAYVRDLERGVINGQAVATEIRRMVSSGFRPDIVIGHNGWGETLFVKDVLPSTPLLSYFEFFYHAFGADTNFDKEFPTSIDDQFRIRIKNSVNLLGLQAADRGITATRWQHSLYPDWAREKISVLHEGVDTRAVAPVAGASFVLPDGRKLTRDAKVITFVARNLEPYRGIHTFVRALPRLLAKVPDAEVVIVGGTSVSYGRAAEQDESHLLRLMRETVLDWSRVWFLGQVTYADYLSLLQVSAAHIYLTYPFVLSWSMLEAMAAGCLVVGSDTPPVAEVIEPGLNGLLVDFFSPEDLAEQLIWASGRPAACARIRQRARETVVRRYDFASCVWPQFDRLLKEMVPQVPAARPKARSARREARIAAERATSAA